MSYREAENLPLLKSQRKKFETLDNRFGRLTGIHIINEEDGEREVPSDGSIPPGPEV